MAGSEAGRTPIHRLLTHTAGFVPDNPLPDYAGGKRALFSAIAREPLAAPPGSRFTYSDVGYVLAQGVAERRLRRRLDVLADELLFQPLRFRDTRFGTRRKDRGRVAPTERADGSWLRGAVHDPRARTRALEGIGGHAGMFGTAREVARFCEMILRRGQLGRKRILSEATVRAMTTDQCEGNLGVRRGFGFDIESAYSAPRGAPLLAKLLRTQRVDGRLDLDRPGDGRLPGAPHELGPPPTATRISRRSAPRPRRWRRGIRRR